MFPPTPSPPTHVIAPVDVLVDAVLLEAANVTAEMEPAAKLPEASLATIADAVFAEVAVVAVLDTLPAVAIVANLVSTMAAEALMSAFTIREVVNKPAASLCTMPVAERFVNVVTPVTVSSPFTVVATATLPMETDVALDVPTLTAPAKSIDVETIEPAVIAPAAKFPDPSRNTMVFGVFVDTGFPESFPLLIGPVIFTSVTAPSAILAVVTLASMMSTVATFEEDRIPEAPTCTSPSVGKLEMKT